MAEETKLEKKPSKKPKKQEAPPVEAASNPVAVFVAGGKQYKVSPGDLVNVDSVGYEVGAEVTFNDVVLVGKTGEESSYKLATGTASVGSVRAKVVALKKAPKVLIFKKRLKGGYTKKQGHRQHYAQIRIEEISAA